MSDDTITYTADIKLPTLEANLTTYGNIAELKHPWFKRAFEDGEDGNQVTVPRLRDMLKCKGYKTELKEDDELLIVKGSFSVILVLHYPAFSDSTIEQIDYIFGAYGQEVRDSMQDEVDRILSDKPLQKVEVCKGSPVKRSPYRDGDWFESCKSDDQ